MEDELPNPDFDRQVPREDPDAEQARLYAFHRENGTLGTYYMMYPRRRPWDWGLSSEEKAAILGSQKERQRGGGNSR